MRFLDTQLVFRNLLSTHLQKNLRSKKSEFWECLDRLHNLLWISQSRNHQKQSSSSRYHEENLFAISRRKYRSCWGGRGHTHQAIWINCQQCPYRGHLQIVKFLFGRFQTRWSRVSFWSLSSSCWVEVSWCLSLHDLSFLRLVVTGCL